MKYKFYNIPISNEIALRTLDFVGGFNINQLIKAIIEASTGKALSDLITNKIIQQMLEVSGRFTPYVNAEAGKLITGRLTKQPEKEKILLAYRFRIANLGLTDKEIEDLIDKKVPEAQEVIEKAKANGSFINAVGLAKKVDGFSVDAAKVLLNETDTKSKICFVVENLNIIGIILAGSTVLLPIPLPANPFFAQLIESGVGYVTAVAAEKAVPVMRRKFGEWWSNTSEKGGEKQLLLNQETGEKRLRYGYEKDDDATSLHSGPPSGNVSEDEGENQQSTQYDSIQPSV